MELTSTQFMVVHALLLGNKINMPVFTLMRPDDRICFYDGLEEMGVLEVMQASDPCRVAFFLEAGEVGFMRFDDDADKSNVYELKLTKQGLDQYAGMQLDKGILSFS